MWLNEDKVTNAAIRNYRSSLRSLSPSHVVIDGLFDATLLKKVATLLQSAANWQTQKHTYSSLYVDNAQWQSAGEEERFVKRDLWIRSATSMPNEANNIANEFLSYLRSPAFMALLSRINDIDITDLNVAKPEVNSNYSRLHANDFVNEHADDSPGRVLCMLLYFNTEWQPESGGELVFRGADDQQVEVAPLFNRCVLFDPSSTGSEHWVKAMSSAQPNTYRYNVTSWYWSE